MSTQPNNNIKLQIHYSRVGQPKEYPLRFKVPQDKQDWAIAFPEYKPPYYVSLEVLANNKQVKANGWADPEESSCPVPLNPIGRTGIAGRGLLGKWGANYAADALIIYKNNNNTFYMLAIKRSDSKTWAIPGGMINNNEPVIQAAERELAEETSVQLSLQNSVEIYSGFADDPRTTDNAWTNTTVLLLLLPAETASKLVLKSGDDAIDVKWLEMTPQNIGQLYSSHKEIAQIALEYLNKLDIQTC